MARVAAVALATPVGDLQATMHALLAGGPPAAGRLGRPLAGQLIGLGHQVLGSRRPDLLLLATTKASTERWCDSLLEAPEHYAGGPASLAAELRQAFGCPGYAVSAACASSPVACAIAGRALGSGAAASVLVLAGDEVSSFVSSGFAALRALDASGCHPFDRDRAGLALGETATALLLEASDAEGLHLEGWGSSLDANHLTGPTRDGRGLERAIVRASHGLPPPSLIIGHGTGTRYNDDSESLAYARAHAGVPVTACKGLLGHSLGACGLAELAIASEILHGSIAPGAVGLRAQGCAGAIRVLPPGRHTHDGGSILLANAGFGGMNGVLRLGRQPAPGRDGRRARLRSRAACDQRGWRAWSAEAGHAGEDWRELREDGQPRIGASEGLGRTDTLWGRMDAACRALVALAVRSGPLPEASAIVLVSERGCAASDRAFELGRRSGACDPQRFAYTLPSTPVGEASIRLGLHGPGFTLLGASDEQARACALALVADGVPAVLLARIEADRTLAGWTETWIAEDT